MERNFSQHVKEILGYSREEAERLQNSNIVPEHLLLGIIRDGANRAVDVLVDRKSTRLNSSHSV